MCLDQIVSVCRHFFLRTLFNWNINNNEGRRIYPNPQTHVLVSVLFSSQLCHINEQP